MSYYFSIPLDKYMKVCYTYFNDKVTNAKRFFTASAFYFVYYLIWRKYYETRSFDRKQRLLPELGH